MEQLIHGEVIEVYGRGLPGQKGREPIGMTVKATSELEARPAGALENMVMDLPQPVRGEQKDELAALYPDRFQANAEDRGVNEFMHNGRGYRVSCFDSHNRLVFEFRCATQSGSEGVDKSIYEQMRALAIWREVGPEELVVFAGRDDDRELVEPGQLRFRAGAFAKLEIRTSVG